MFSELPGYYYTYGLSVYKVIREETVTYEVAKVTAHGIKIYKRNSTTCEFGTYRCNKQIMLTEQCSLVKLKLHEDRPN